MDGYLTDFSWNELSGFFIYIALHPTKSLANYFYPQIIFSIAIAARFIIWRHEPKSLDALRFDALPVLRWNANDFGAPRQFPIRAYRSYVTAI